MNQQKKCARCAEIKDIDNFYDLYSTCKTCSIEHSKNYQEGINADLKSLAPHTRAAVLDARELLELMGYDLNKSVNLQFKERIMLKYGVDIDNPPKRPKNPFKRFL
jgi:hypothetical protein